MEDALSPHTLDAVARTVERSGIDSVPTETIDQLAVAATDLGAHPIIAQVALDHSEPRVARERALLRLVARVLGRGPTDAVNREFCLA